MNHATPLKIARIEAGLTCTTLAGCVGVSRCHLSLVENGRRTPSKELLERVRAALEACAASKHLEHGRP